MLCIYRKVKIHGPVYKCSFYAISSGFTGLEYRKISVFGTSKMVEIYLKMEQFYNAVMVSKDADGIAISMDPDQTAP